PQKSRLGTGSKLDFCLVASGMVGVPRERTRGANKTLRLMPSPVSWRYGTGNQATPFDAEPLEIFHPNTRRPQLKGKVIARRW
ncbi:MAG: hypothetical protein WCH61_01520, partial [bacterium]